MAIAIEKLAPALGAEVTGLHLSLPIEGQLVSLLQSAYREHGILLFRDQDIDDAALVRFARHFGELQTFRQPCCSSTPYGGSVASRIGTAPCSSSASVEDSFFASLIKSKN